jgi:hypothetical protein
MPDDTAPATPAFGSPEWFDEVFTYHAPGPTQIDAYAAIRESGKLFARTIVAHTPRCADQTAAVRKVREAVATANAAVALKGLV